MPCFQIHVAVATVITGRCDHVEVEAGGEWTAEQLEPRPLQISANDGVAKAGAALTRRRRSDPDMTDWHNHFHPEVCAE